MAILMLNVLLFSRHICKIVWRHKNGINLASDEPARLKASVSALMVILEFIRKYDINSGCVFRAELDEDGMVKTRSSFSQLTHLLFTRFIVQLNVWLQRLRT